MDDQNTAAIKAALKSADEPKEYFWSKAYGKTTFHVEGGAIRSAPAQQQAATGRGDPKRLFDLVERKALPIIRSRIPNHLRLVNGGVGRPRRRRKVGR